MGFGLLLRNRLTLSVAVAITLTSLVVITADVSAQQAAPAAEATTTQLRELADAVRRNNFDAAATTRADRLLELTARRIWNYHGDDGKLRAYEGAYDAEVVRSGTPCLMFASRQYVPLSRLDAQGTADLAEIGKLRTEVRQDFLNLQTELARRQAEAIEAQRQAELARQQELAKLQRRRAQILAETTIEVVEPMGTRMVTLSAGEVFDIVGETPTQLMLLVGARPTPVARELCAEVKPTVVLKPIDVAPAAVAEIAAPKLDCRIGSYVFPDGRTALQLEAVALGGLADRYQMQVGEVLERVNDFPVATLDDYRIASTRAGGGLKLVLFNPELGRSRVVIIPPPNAAVPLGVFGHVDIRQEFVINDVLDGSVAAELGLKRNDKILRVNGLPIGSEEQLRQIEATSGGNFRIRAIVDGTPKTLVFP
jgi:hypothetical protein